MAKIERPTFYYHFKDKYDLVAWIFLNDAYDTDIMSAKSAAQGMAKMRQEFIFYKRAYDDVSQNALWQYMLEYFVKRYELIAKEKLKIKYRNKFYKAYCCKYKIGSHIQLSAKLAHGIGFSCNRAVYHYL